MDKTTGKSKEIMIKKYMEQLRADMKGVYNAHEEFQKMVKEKIESRTISAKDKGYLMMFRGLEGVTQSLLSMIVESIETLLKFEKRIRNVERILQKVTEQADVDLSSIKSELNELKNTLKDPMFANIDQFIRQIKENIEKRKQAGEGYVD